MQNTTLVIMAAGLGSRYGGAKQIAPVDSEGHAILDYSLYDAIRAGFQRAVLVISEDMEQGLRERFGQKIAPHIDLQYAHQRLDMLPEGFSLPAGRKKPWGTGHAVLCAKDLIDGPFAAINADDFYGRTAFAALHDFLSTGSAENAHAMVGYRIENTLSESGYVARGICEADGAGNLTAIHERTHIKKLPDGPAYTEDGTSYTKIPDGAIVSMNFWGFRHSMLAEIEKRFAAFLRDTLPSNPTGLEYFLPSVVNQLLKERAATVTVLETDEKWYGITYKEDMEAVWAAIARMKRDGHYPDRLWRN